MSADETAIAVSDLEDLEHVARIVSDVDADITALKAKKKCLVDNMTALIREAESKRALVLRWYLPIIENLLRNKKKKQVRTAWGVFSIRQYQGSIKATNEGAVEWTAKVCPNAVRTTKEVMVSLFTPEVRERVFGMTDEALEKAGFKVDRPSEMAFYAKG